MAPSYRFYVSFKDLKKKKKKKKLITNRTIQARKEVGEVETIF